MNFKQLLSSKIQEFINSNLDTDVTRLALSKNPFPEIEYTSIINQIKAKQKSKEKLPLWYTTSNIIFPSNISVEQTSSEVTAKYKLEIVSGDTLIDLSGGFGIDDYYFSKKIKSVTHCEINSELSKIVAYNFNVLNAINIKCINQNSTDYLKESNDFFDWIYIDPSRRNEKKGKVFMFEDCEPNVPDLLTLYFSKSNNILIKTAPLLDLQAGIEELKHVKKIHIVAVQNEVKELLWEITKGYEGIVKIVSVNIEKDKQTFVETIHQKEYNVEFSLPLKYVYEPNASILKSGSFDAISQIYDCQKLHKNSHLYTSNTLIEFPGRRFIIENIITLQKSEVKEHLIGKKMNISTRNFPIKVEELKKKYKIKDGGTTFAFFTTNIENKKIALICKKI
ncbi:THUMP-like domain-containing protein [Flavobacterium sp. N2270]|uniref:THUMP-like domain-containing protein n=1 Tax=Flavobacterium sp. N2270 TaxID=2986831 RepID=UPI00222550D1|nr:class I SAM-dependent methyltransferase [Flavobacterium sp. N2270]